MISTLRPAARRPARQLDAQARLAAPRGPYEEAELNAVQRALGFVDLGTRGHDVRLASRRPGDHPLWKSGAREPHSWVCTRPTASPFCPSLPSSAARSALPGKRPPFRRAPRRRGSPPARSRRPRRAPSRATVSRRRAVACRDPRRGAAPLGADDRRRGCPRSGDERAEATRASTCSSARGSAVKAKGPRRAACDSSTWSRARAS